MTDPDTSVPLLHDKQLRLADCLEADFSFLDRYQETVNSQIVWDTPEAISIKGKLALQYMVDGIVEETAELRDPDAVEPSYSRAGVLMMMDQAQAPTETAVKRHLKEFGDVAWYLANFLGIIGVRYSSVIEPGLAEWSYDESMTSSGFMAETERDMPGVLLALNVGRMRFDAKLMLREQHGNTLEIRDRVITTAGTYTLAAMLTLANRYGTSYEAVLASNVAKIDKRISDGTVFQKSGGDDR